VFTITYAQKIEGIATYKTKRKLDIPLDSVLQESGINDVMQKQLQAMLKKQFEKEYTLEFSESQSIFKEVVKLENSNFQSSGISMSVQTSGAGGENDILYKNLKEDKYINQTEVFGKLFLIEDHIEKKDWKLSKETKHIGQYTCFKATYCYDREVSNSFSFQSKDSSSEDSPKKESVTITAWYTPQIPVQNGPKSFNGLPGLILEVSDGEETILCSKVVLNPQKGITFKEPKTGKKVTQEKFDAIIEKKAKEMRGQFQGGNRRNGGSNFEIRISE